MTEDEVLHELFRVAFERHPRLLDSRDAAAAEYEARLADEPATAAFRAFLDEHGLALHRGEDVRLLCRALYEACEERGRRLKREAASMREYAARDAWTGPSARAVRRLEAELEVLNDVANRLHRHVKPALIRGQPRSQLPRCRECRAEFSDAHEAFQLLHLCQSCRDDADARRESSTSERGGVRGVLDALLAQL